MKLRLPLLDLATAILLATSQPALAADKWLKAETKHFVIFSTGKPEELERFARNTEKFDALLRLLTRVQPEEQPLRLPIYILSSAESVASLMDDKTRSVAGFYRPSKYGSFAVANRARANDRTDLKGDTVLQHEYAHHFMFRNFAYAYPAWYIEGFAEFVATADFAEDGSWTVGKPPLHRAYGLILGKDLPIERLLFGRTSGMPRDLTDVYYGRAWLLVHMLRNDKTRASQLETYLRALGSGMPEGQAAKQTFGDLAELDRQLDRYLDQKRISITKSAKPLDYANSIRISQLDAIDSQLVALELNRRSQKDLPGTRDQLTSLAAKAPDRASVWLELAQVEQTLAHGQEKIEDKRAGWALAEAAVDKALAINPAHGRANLIKAELLFERLQSENLRTPQAWKPVHAHISKANRADPLDPAPLFTWYDAFVAQGLKPDKLASDGLALAHSLAPEAIDLRVRYAWDLARQEKFEEAIRVIQFVVRDPHNSEQGSALIERLQKMRDAAKQGGGGATGSND